MEKIVSMTLAENLGKKDMEDFLEEKLKQAVQAREVFAKLELEYVEWVRAAAVSGEHPQAVLRLEMYQSLRSFFAEEK